MRPLRMLTILVALIIGWAQPYGQGYNPDTPDEPGVPPVQLTLYASPADGGTVSGGGKHVPGTNVRISASAKSGFRFVEWTDLYNNVVSTTATFNITKAATPESYIAHFEYDPDIPGEPEPGTSILYYKLNLIAGEGGSVNGGGKYQSGSHITIMAYPSYAYRFLNWTNEDGEEIATSAEYTYTTQAKNETLYANFAFDPEAPGDPSDPVLSHTITLTATEGGGCNFASKRVLEGSTTYIDAWANNGYAFKGWYCNGELYCSTTSFDYVMGKSDISFEARFEYNPETPDDPMSPSSKLSLYLMSEVTYPGCNVVCPLFINCNEEICDMTFDLTFPIEIQPDWSTLELDPMVGKYNINVLSEGKIGTYRITLTGHTLSNYNGPLFAVVLDVPETVACTSYQVKINQVSISLPTQETVTSLTRNGRVYVYELGDNNGDGKVDLLDYVNMSLYLLTDGHENEVFIDEVSDVNEDGRKDLLDAVNILEILMNR